MKTWKAVKYTGAIILACGMVLTWGVAQSVHAEEDAGPSVQEQETKVYTDGAEAGELTLRFYEDMPHVPYLGIGAY